MRVLWLLFVACAMVSLLGGVCVAQEGGVEADGFEEEDVGFEEESVESTEAPPGGAAGEQPEIPLEVRQELQRRTVTKLLARVSGECQAYLRVLISGKQPEEPNVECDEELQKLAPEAQQEAVQDMQQGVPETPLGQDAAGEEAQTQAEAVPDSFGSDHMIILAVLFTLVAGIAVWWYGRYQAHQKYLEDHADEIAAEEERKKRRAERKARRSKGRRPPADDDDDDEITMPRVRPERELGVNASKKKLRKRAVE